MSSLKGRPRIVTVKRGLMAKKKMSSRRLCVGEKICLGKWGFLGIQEEGKSATKLQVIISISWWIDGLIVGVSLAFLGWKLVLGNFTLWSKSPLKVILILLFFGLNHNIFKVLVICTKLPASTWYEKRTLLMQSHKHMLIVSLFGAGFLFW